MNTPNQGLLTRETGPSKSKNPFIDPYCAYHRFYRHRTEDCRDLQALAEQRTQKKVHPSFGENRGRNNSPYQSNEQHHGRRQDARDERQKREVVQRECGRT
ncbi:hypothetical protein Fot_41967 [Forsythia ovata]|uniref:Uncharacterized protein n=1 Tax=Forsythia ovata TaxID=205694 RepID=A0ABD1RJU7_9LAMI